MSITHEAAPSASSPGGAGPAAADFSPYAAFSREEWSALRGKIPVPLAEAELEQLQGIDEDLSLDEVADILKETIAEEKNADEKLNKIAKSKINEEAGVA